MNHRVIVAVFGATAALAVPTVAAAHGNGNEKKAGEVKPISKKAKAVTFIFKGTFTAPGTLAVTSGNAHVRRGGFVGHTVRFDAASARIAAADANADSKIDLSDVKDGDSVLVHARILKGTTYAESPTAEPIAARKLVDKTNPPVEDVRPDSGD
jgi:hypothetical protein